MVIEQVTKKIIDSRVSISKPVMNDIQVSQLVIAKTNNGIAMRLYYNVGTVSQTVRSGNGPYIAKDHARPALHTVFSTTQLGHFLIAKLVFLRSRIWKCFHSKEQRGQT
jgi:hypothetical protein